MALASEPYGAVDPAWLAAWVREHGPWGYHVTLAAHTSSILSDGLVPWDERYHQPVFEAASTPRKGHVYLSTDADGCDHQWELSGITPAAGAVVLVNLEGIDPRRIVPDEDPWSLDLLRPDEPVFGVTPPGRLHDGARWTNGGAWAEDVRLGSQPGVVEWAVAEWRRIAVRGRITPDLLRVIACDARGRWRDQLPVMAT